MALIFFSVGVLFAVSMNDIQETLEAKKRTTNSESIERLNSQLKHSIFEAIWVVFTWICFVVLNIGIIGLDAEKCIDAYRTGDIVIEQRVNVKYENNVEVKNDTTYVMKRIPRD